MSKNSRVLAKRVGENISARRRACQWSQEQLADKLGLASDTVSRFERGVTAPSLSTIQEIAEVLGLRISDLFSESSLAPEGQVEVILAWMRPLALEERAFVLDLVKQTCDFLLRQKANLHTKIQTPSPK